MAYSLHPAAVEDARTFAIIFKEAFSKDPIIAYLKPKVPVEAVLQKDTAKYREMIEEGNVYGNRLNKVVENDSGKIVAFSLWQYPHHITPEQAEAKKEKEERAKKGPHPEGTNVALTEDFFKKLYAGRRKWIVPDKTYFVQILAVDPDYQRKGIGSMLLEPGLKEADKAGAQTYIEASPFGLPLYLKLGWEPVDEMVFDMTPHGGDGIRRNISMMREPNAPRKDA